ncbi:MAG: hypothetical protein JRF33_13660 [Deltaproteobacteria bacterium]|nr:hypothetical protein [Deltaproteobacteria bacterium]
MYRLFLLLVLSLFALACSSGGTVDAGMDGPMEDAGNPDAGVDANTDTDADAGTTTDQDPIDASTGPDADDGASGVQTIGGCQIFPADNMWNTPIDTAELHPLSDTYIQSIGPDTQLHPDFGTEWQGYLLGIPYTTVPDDQAMVDTVFEYNDESDPGPYPIPADAPIEGGPDADGDRHVIVVREGACILYEMYAAYPQEDGSWEAGSGAIWQLDQNEVRPQDWTSADAAGLAILPGLLRWEEVYETGEIKHAMRVTLSYIQHAYILPATHSDGQCGYDRDCPPMGLRLRLKASFDESGFDEALQIIFRGMKKYGLVVADTGGDMFVSGAHDMRWDDSLLHDFHQLSASDFEAVYTGDSIDY